MSFKAMITSPESQGIWYRVVQTISNINQDINITITPSGLLMWAMNSTDTTMCQVSFHAKFFGEFHFQPNEILFGDEGIQEIEDLHGKSHRLFSLQINGRHLSILSRKPDGDNIQEFTLMINNSAICPESMVNRLQVRVHTESLITKEFNPVFVPIKYDPIVIDLKYKKKFLDIYAVNAGSQANGSLDPRLLNFFVNVRQQLDEAMFNRGIMDIERPKVLLPEHEINFISMDGIIWKNFIDACTAITEEVKLDMDMNKMVITAFTRGVYNMKSQDVLKQAISMSNSVDIRELEHYCIFSTSGERSSRVKNSPSKQIAFKLKDFKNFFGINQAWKSSGVVNSWFCLPGDPILFEIDRSDVKLSLYQITDSVERSALQQNVVVQPLMVSPKKYAPPTLTAERQEQHFEIHKTACKRELFVTDSERRDDGAQQYQKMHASRPSSMVDENYDHNTPIFQSSLKEKPQYISNAEARRMGTTITWGANQPKNTHTTEDSATIIKREKHNHLQQLKMRRIEDGRAQYNYLENNDEPSQDTGLGPTQPSQPKGLFD